MRYHKIPDETIERLPVYLRGLFSLEKDRKHISSRDLADFLGVNSWLIRKDFSYFGSFGTPGVGYDIKKVVKQINKILTLDVGHKIALVGVGNLGRALLFYPGFERYGFVIAAAFDRDPKKIGRKINNIIIEDVSKLKTLRKQKIDVGVVAVPVDAAQETVDLMVKAGLKGILNFSPCPLDVPKKTKVITIDIATDLARLPYYIPTCRS